MFWKKRKALTGDGMEERITIGSPDGIELDQTVYDKRTVFRNVTVEILENTKTGKVSIGWYKQSDTEEIDDGI